MLIEPDVIGLVIVTSVTTALAGRMTCELKPEATTALLVTDTLASKKVAVINIEPQ
jgi:hypothetical protein